MEAVSSFWFNTQFTLVRAPLVLKLKTLNTKLLASAVDLFFENENYIVKTASTAEELAQVLSLRFEVFFREFSTRKITFSFFPYDIDMHDFLCDHLIVKDKESNKVIACYRLLTETTKKKKSFYSEGEFKLQAIHNLPGNKLELGRACVHKDFRKGTVVALLWKGLLEYARLSRCRYMFGCSSITRKDFVNFPKIIEWLKSNNALIKDQKIEVQEKYALENHPNIDLTGNNAKDSLSPHKALGSLMHMYIMAGAKMSQAPAYDAEMDCLDMFTLIDLHNLPPSFARKFQC